MKPARSKGKGNAKAVRFFSSNRTTLGRRNEERRLTGKSLRDEVTVEHLAARKRRLEDLETGDQESKKSRDTSPGGFDFDYDPSPNDDADLFLSGEAASSHAGGEFFDVWFAQKKEASSAKFRPRRDRVERRNAGFQQQLDQMVVAFMEWDSELGDKGLDEVSPANDLEGDFIIQVVDVYRTYQLRINVGSDDHCTVALLIRAGVFPCAPLRPTVAITTRALDLFRTLHFRCPHLSAQAFVKSLCDTHKVDYRAYLLQQFSIALDVFTQVKNEVQARVDRVLNREGNWRLRNACSACTYRLAEEAPLRFSMLVTMDGNDSLKRVHRSKEVFVEEGPRIQSSIELTDGRKVEGDRYLSREQVDCWANQSKEPLAKSPDGAVNPCASRWANMDDAGTARAMGAFDETGLFLSLCRHGYTLVMADMVQSGEMAKYPISVVSSLLDAFGANIGGGYDIGCKFKTTLARSPLGNQATALKYTALVGSFHGHAHNRICQLSHLATYVEGMGLEDLEGCERFFSKSNALASSVRHASIFRRRQQISEYTKYVDAMETSQNLSKFLVANYRQALLLLEDEPALQKAMAEYQITDTGVFRSWLNEEREYLTSLSKEPIEETLEMDYCQCLIDLKAAKSNLERLRVTPIQYTPNVTPVGSTKTKGSPEKQLKDVEEIWMTLLLKTQDLEQRIGVETRWTEDCDTYKQALEKLKRRKYQRCLDELEGLVVSRIFELTKIGMSQTGYNARKHIATALRTRSAAVMASLKRYNAASAALFPLRKPLPWSEVVDYAFLSEFDLLRDCRQDIQKKPWARPAGRALMDRFFKLERAREEIQRLNIEIRRVVTHLHDEKRFLLAKEAEVAHSDPLLAHQIKRYGRVRTQFTNLHLERFTKLASHPKFSGNITPGLALDQDLILPYVAEKPNDNNSYDAQASIGGLVSLGEEEDDEAFEEAEADGEAEFEALYATVF